VISVPDIDYAEREALLHSRYQSLMIAEAATIVLVCVMVGRLMFKRAQRKATSMFAPAADVTGMKHAVDAIALEVERISENQRYATKLLQERAEPLARFEAGAKVPMEERRDRT
jgi:hypothetical protein